MAYNGYQQESVLKVATAAALELIGSGFPVTLEWRCYQRFHHGCGDICALESTFVNIESLTTSNKAEGWTLKKECGRCSKNLRGMSLSICDLRSSSL